VAILQPHALPFGLDGSAWEQRQSPFMEVGGVRSSVREWWWWSGVVITDGGRCGGVLAVAVTMFTCVVTATPRSVLTN